MEIDETIFKAYDIRGLVPQQLNPEIVYRIGKAVVEFLGCSKVVIGRDMRESSEEFSKQLIRGITDQGADVTYIGLCTTPMNYYANGMLGADASVMITASHNPAGWNGFKICRMKAIPLSGDTGIMEIKELVKKNDFAKGKAKGTLKEKEILKDYCNFIREHYHNKQQKPLKIIADLANSMGAYEIKALESLEGLNITKMYEKLDATFPNHEANPLKTETLEALQKKVIEEKADLGIAFDGDADRCGFVDEKGNAIRNDFITALIAKDILDECPGQKIFYDLRSSKVVKKAIEEKKGNAMMCRVGHAFIKEQMRQENAVFAGELSGHYYFQENFNAESAALASVRIINLLIKTGKKLSELADELKVFYQSGEINKKVSDPKKIMQKIEERYKDAEISHLDGVSVQYDDWWFNIRSSNTEPVLRLNLEADTKEKMEQKTEEVLGMYE